MREFEPVSERQQSKTTELYYFSAAVLKLRSRLESRCEFTAPLKFRLLEAYFSPFEQTFMTVDCHAAAILLHGRWRTQKSSSHVWLIIIENQ